MLLSSLVSQQKKGLLGSNVLYFWLWEGKHCGSIQATAYLPTTLDLRKDYHQLGNYSTERKTAIAEKNLLYKKSKEVEKFRFPQIIYY